MRRTSGKVIAVLVVLLGSLTFAFPSGSSIAKSLLGYDPTYQTPELLYDEARTVNLGNLARRANGVAPLRWNLEMTHAARWFSWDSVVNRPGGYCGHQDTLGNAPWDRVAYFGYTGFGGAENAFCGYVTPEQAIQGWLDSPGHRDNLLDPGWREIGLGYYRRSSDGRGYVAQVFGVQDNYAPVIIDNEAVSTSDPSVDLYIYDRNPRQGFTGWSGATQMMISNSPQFSGGVWEPFNIQRAWTLSGGTGWRSVYVKIRDQLNRTSVASDTIYLGTSVPLQELGDRQMTRNHSKVILHGLNGGSFPAVQFSLGWLVDDADEAFTHWWGNAQQVNEAAAWGGTAYRLSPGDGETLLSVFAGDLPLNTPLTAYIRLKVNNNTSSSEVARINIEGPNDTEYGPLGLRGTDFHSPNQYQEFALNFVTPADPNNSYLFFTFARTGSADVYVDAVSIFTRPQPVTSPLVWSVPGNSYRGQGIWIRYTNGTQFTDFMEAPFVELPGQSFADVADSYWAWDFIERLYATGITGGCGTNPLRYCPDEAVTRDQMAVFLLRGVHGSSYAPPAVGSSTGFGDVPASYWSAAWIKQLAAEGITSGCGAGKYCPGFPVNRAEMAVFLLKAKHGKSYTPPAVGGSTGFGDVPPGHWAAAWIKRLVAEGITAGCGSGIYCPDAPVTRAQMAVFLVKTFNLP